MSETRMRAINTLEACTIAVVWFIIGGSAECYRSSQAMRPLEAEVRQLRAERDDRAAIFEAAVEDGVRRRLMAVPREENGPRIPPQALPIPERPVEDK